jgi:hypothetical protein
MKIYLDINGTIIHKKLEKNKAGVRSAAFLKEFLENILEKHDVYWLSTICNGDVDEVLSYLKMFLTPEELTLAERVKPTKWGSYKVDAIDLNGEFLWFDDVLLPKEEEMLKNAGKIDSFVKVDHYQKQDFFKEWLNI